MAIKRIHPYVETDDLDASRSFYTEVFGLQVAMETPVMSLQAPDLTSAQVIVCPRGFETPQPDFGIDVGDPEAVEQAHAHVHDRGLRVVYPLTTEPWGSDGSSSRTPTADHQRPRAPPKRHLSGIRSHMPGDHARSRSPACAARPCDDPTGSSSRHGQIEFNVAVGDPPYRTCRGSCSKATDTTATSRALMSLV